MNELGVVIPAAGMGRRLGLGKPKAFVELSGKPLFVHSLLTFLQLDFVKEIVLVFADSEIEAAKEVIARLETHVACSIQCVAGGVERQDSVRNGLAKITSDFVAVHDAARPFVSPDIIKKVFEKACETGAAIAAHKAVDTMKFGVNVIDRTLDRALVWHAQTPQIFGTKLLREANSKAEAEKWQVTDDASIVERFGNEVTLVESDASNKKITFSADLKNSIENKMIPRIGFGYDVHQLVEGRKLILGGVEIPFEKGLLGHSDADVLLHAITDAILGAAAMGDIGKHFPDTDPAYKGADSRVLLRKTLEIISNEGFKIGNIDATVVAEKPKLISYIEVIRENIASDLNIPLDSVSVKATTSEKMGFVGRKEGMACHTVATLFQKTVSF